MASGDVRISIAVEGGVTKSAVVDSETRVAAKAYADSVVETDLSADADYLIHQVNKFAGMIVADANRNLDNSATASVSHKTIATAAS